MRISEARGFKIGAADAVALYAGASKLWPAASADITPVQVIGLNGGGTKSVVFNASKGWSAPKPGNLLIAVAIASSSGVTKPAGFTDLLPAGASARTVAVWYKVATGSETSVTIGAFGGWLLEVPTTATPVAGDAMQQSYATSAFTFNLGPLTPSVGKCLAIGAAAWNISNQGGWTTDAGWTLVTEGDGISFGSALVFKVLDASLTPAQVSITGTKANVGGAAFLLIKER